MSQIVLYTLPDCARCELLKQTLSQMNVEYQIERMTSPAAQTDLLSNGVFVLSAPVLRINNTFLTINELFVGDVLNKQTLEAALHGNQ